MASPDKELRDKIAAEAEHAEASRDADLPYRRRRSPHRRYMACGCLMSGSTSCAGLQKPAVLNRACWCGSG